MFTFIIICSEFSPYIFENVILKFFPFLQFHAGRGIFYMILGSFCLDPAMGFWCIVAGSGLIICGIMYVLAFCLIDHQKAVMEVTVPKVTQVSGAL